MPLNHPAAVYWQAFQPKKQRALRWNYSADGASEIVVAAVHAEADVGSTVDTAGAAYSAAGAAYSAAGAAAGAAYSAAGAAAGDDA